MPCAAGNRRFGANEVAALAIDDFVKAEGVAQGTGAHDVIISLILNAKSNASHLLFFASHRFEASDESEIAESFIFENQQRKVLVGCILGHLREHGLFCNYIG